MYYDILMNISYHWPKEN